MFWNVVWQSKHIHHVDLAGNLSQISVNLFAQDFSYFRVINRHRHNFVTRSLHVPGNVMRRLICMRRRFYPEHRDAPCSIEQRLDLFVRCQKIRFPFHFVILSQILAIDSRLWQYNSCL